MSASSVAERMARICKREDAVEDAHCGYPFDGRCDVIRLYVALEESRDSLAAALRAAERERDEARAVLAELLAEVVTAKRPTSEGFITLVRAEIYDKAAALAASTGETG